MKPGRSLQQDIAEDQTYIGKLDKYGNPDGHGAIYSKTNQAIEMESTWKDGFSEGLVKMYYNQKGKKDHTKIQYYLTLQQRQQEAAMKMTLVKL